MFNKLVTSIRRLFMVAQNPTMASNHVWSIDSSCTRHMIKDERIFTKLDKTCKIKVKLGNGAIIKAQGKMYCCYSI